MSSKYKTALDSNKLEKKFNAKKLMEADWLGQTVASLCWITSMYYYGLDSVGDKLQLCAGVTWFIANMASLNKA